jgi:hypothetical protein
MTAAGWSVDVACRVPPAGYGLPAFRRPVDGEFTATVSFVRPGPWVGDEPVEFSARVGVDLEGAYRLAPRVLGRESYSECDTGLGDLLDPSEPLVMTMSSVSDADHVADLLVASVVSHALDYARAHTTLEDLLGSARADPELFHQEVEQVPLLLAAAGRHDDARDALVRYQATGEYTVSSTKYRRFARQLTLWMDAGGVLPDPPTGPVRAAADWSRQAPMSIRDARRTSRARREAFDTVRHQAAGKTTDEVRIMLREEYDRRGIKVSQLAIESGVEMIERRQSTLGTVTATVQGVGLVATEVWRMANRIGSLVKMARGGDPPARAEPVAWLEPPQQAAYPVKGDRDHEEGVTVLLDEEAGEFLGRAHAAGRPLLGGPAFLRMINTVILDAWLSWGASPPGESGRLRVHLGDRAVGALTPDDARRYQSVMAAAVERHELPTMKATLTTFDRAPYWLLEITAPRADA